MTTQCEDRLDDHQRAKALTHYSKQAIILFRLFGLSYGSHMQKEVECSIFLKGVTHLVKYRYMLEKDELPPLCKDLA